MSVSYDQILNKMMKEIQEAHMMKTKPEKVKEHVRAVKLLGDLILDDESGMDNSVPQPSSHSQVYKATHKAQPQTTPTPAPTPKPSIDHEEANGDSLLDF